MIICDTREQKNAHILKYFDTHKIPYRIDTVDTADYMMEDGQWSIRVERKATLSELAHNLMSKDRGRFYREIRRAHEMGIKLYIVCEHGHGIERIEDVVNWQNPFGKVTGRQLREAIFRCAIGYGCEFIFCNRRQTGKIIADILENGGITR